MSRFVRGRRSRFAAQISAQISALTLGSLLILPESRPSHAGSPAELGVWVDDQGKGAIEISPCGPALCGRIVWLKNPLNDAGQPLSDKRNPDATKRNRPICGLPVIGNLKRTSEGWDGGWIYSPEEGAQYDLAIAASSRNQLTVTGYKGIKLFSKTFTWTRAPADLQRCGDQPQETKAIPPKGKTEAGAAAAPATRVQAEKPAPAPAPAATTKPAGQVPKAKAAAKDAPAGTAAAPASAAKTVPAAKKAPAALAKSEAPAGKSAKQPKAAASPADPGSGQAQKKAAKAAPATDKSGKSAAPDKTKQAVKTPATKPAAKSATAAKPQPAAQKPAAKKKPADDAEEASTAEQ